MTKKQRRIKSERQQELLKHFGDNGYEEKKVGDKWYVKQWNGNTKRWQVAVYSEPSFQRYKAFQRGEYKSERREQYEHLKSIMGGDMV